MDSSRLIIGHLVHYGLHLGLPFALGWLFGKKLWWKAGLIMLATLLIDLDHLLADPIFGPGRWRVGVQPGEAGAARLILPHWKTRAVG